MRLLGMIDVRLVDIDALIVAAYFVGIFIAGAILARRFAGRQQEFLTGGRTFTWKQTGLTLLAFAVDPTYMGMAGIAFLWGMYVLQWTAVHIWFTSWFAAMFLVPIYWRTRIVTTPEYLEHRFNAQCRALFSVLMAVILVIILTSALYLGSLLLTQLTDWRLPVSIAVIVGVCGFYVLAGGLRTVLTLDVYQGAFLLITLAVVAWRVLAELGGPGALAALDEPGKAGVPLSTLVPPGDADPFSAVFFPGPAILLWATVAGLSWIGCNFGMVQRLLASRSEADAQKSLLLLAVLANIACALTFIVGVAMHKLFPGLKPDQAFMNVMLDMFPVGVRGLLVAGMMAALLSSVDGLMTASGTLITQDIYRRFLRPDADAVQTKRVTRIIEAAALIVAISLVPVVKDNYDAAVAFVQDCFGDLLGPVVALFIVGVFSRRATPRAALISVIASIGLAAGLHALSILQRTGHFGLGPSDPLNFAYRGFLSFAAAIVLTLVLSRFEPAPDPAKLTNLTVHTLEDVRGPWVGLKAWPGLWKWALGIGVGWFAVTAAWELFRLR